MYEVVTHFHSRRFHFRLNHLCVLWLSFSFVLGLQRSFQYLSADEGAVVFVRDGSLRLVSNHPVAWADGQGIGYQEVFQYGCTA
jgi:hypothetical protein